MDNKWINTGYENKKGTVMLLWQCTDCGYETIGDMNPPAEKCPICELIDKSKPIYAIAYSEHDGADYAENEPFIFDVGHKETAKIYAEEMQKEGFQNVTVFKYKRRKAITNRIMNWEYIQKRAV